MGCGCGKRMKMNGSVPIRTTSAQPPRTISASQLQSPNHTPVTLIKSTAVRRQV